MIYFKSLIIAIILTVLPITVSAGDIAPDQLVQEYFQAIKNQDWSTAESFWDESYIQSSKRLGISYQNISVKYDCASPMALASGLISSGLVTLAIDSMITTDDYAQIMATLKTGFDTVSATYFAVMTDAGWKLTTPSKLFTRDWNRLTTRYLNLYFSDSSRINDYACQSVDNFIETTGKLLGLTDDEMNRLSKQKIDYYLCDKEEIKKITGYDAAGMTDLPSDAIISRYFPHNHELTHLLVNYASSGLPLYTQPILQEGLACHFGGRWGRASNVIKYAGNAIIDFEVVRLEELMSYSGFKHQVAMPDISYPVSSLFVGYLIEAVGMENFLHLYRQFSGDDTSDLVLRSAEDLTSGIENITGQSWSEIKANFDAYRAQFNHGGIAPIETGPTGQADYFIQAGGGGVAISVHCQPDGNIFDILLPNNQSAGTILFLPLDTLSQKYKSRLFSEQHPGTTYSGSRFGLRFSSVEASLYDYRCNDLIATFSTGFSPEETMYDSSGHHLRFAIDRTVFGEAFDSFAIEVMTTQ